MIIVFLIVGKNTLNEKERNDLLCLLRELAFADDKNVYQKRLNLLYKSQIYKQNDHVRKYLEQNWLGCTQVSKHC